MLTKQVIIGLISVRPDMSLEIREDTIIYEDEAILSTVYVQSTAFPGDDVSGKPKVIQDIAGILWTPEVIAAYQAKQAESNQPGFPTGE